MNNITKEPKNKAVDINSIYRLDSYFVWPPRGIYYPTFRLKNSATAFFNTREEAEEAMKTMLKHRDLYCRVLSELPVGVNFHYGESFSDRIYLPDGQLWSERPYACMYPYDIPSPYSEIEYDNYLYGRCFFQGRKAQEIRFKPGDIIEIFGYEGNHYWSAGYGELAIVLDTPPTEDEMKARAEHYLKTSQHLTGDKGFDLGVQFNYHDDAYAIVAALGNIDSESNPVDFCPTYCAMMPSMEKVSTKMRNKLESLREKVMANEEWKKKFMRRKP